MTIALLLAACGKNEQPAGRAATRDKVATAALLKQTDIDPNDVLSATRKGEKVTIRWDADFSDCKGISVLRNAVEQTRNSRTVAKLPANSMEYVDTVPNARVFWYWIVVDIDGNRTKRIGPVRARADAGKTTEYASAAKDITFIARRTESSVVVAWDLPSGKYKGIVIRRRDRPVMAQGRDQLASMVVHSTSERSGDIVDQLPNPRADYWYWIEVSKEDGSVITKGPTKAKFEALDTPQDRPKSQPKAVTKSKTKGKTKGKR